MPTQAASLSSYFFLFQRLLVNEESFSLNFPLRARGHQPTSRPRALDELSVLESQEPQENLLRHIIKVLGPDKAPRNQELPQWSPPALEALEPVHKLGVVGSLSHDNLEGVYPALWTLDSTEFL